MNSLDSIMSYWDGSFNIIVVCNTFVGLLHKGSLRASHLASGLMISSDLKWVNIRMDGGTR
jgi:hypothetical protein